MKKLLAYGIILSITALVIMAAFTIIRVASDDRYSNWRLASRYWHEHLEAQMFSEGRAIARSGHYWFGYPPFKTEASPEPLDEAEPTSTTGFPAVHNCPAPMSAAWSVADYLKSRCEDGSLMHRVALAEEAGINDYVGSPEQNEQLLAYLRSKDGTSGR